MAFQLLEQASPAVSGTSADAEANANLLVSVARDIAQGAIVANDAMSQTAALTANAEHDLLIGNATLGVTGLEQAWHTAEHL